MFNGYGMIVDSSFCRISPSDPIAATRSQAEALVEPTAPVDTPVPGACAAPRVEVLRWGDEVSVVTLTLMNT